ncbi:C39 family peptidase [Anaerovorax odorimutans]|uniref:C39 family peptidase n=1 Tax=Anaerovorax odorimutans TaxID=109327 RepID=UPI00040AFF54|nr:papain-like cysteine protease family protein [Anaerovorax odorimutans]
MKAKKVMCILISFIFVISFTACTGGNNANNVSPFEKHNIDYPDGYITDESGASSYNGLGDHFNSQYFSHLDFYNMNSSDNLTIIPNFKTYQQTTEYTCGACAALMVLNYYGNNKYDEMTIAKMANISDKIGVGPKGIADFFNQIGWNVKSSLEYNGENTFNNTEEFEKWVIENLSAETPIMIDWIDWCGHWQVIIGYDTMGTKDNFGDDVIILADSYDTSDHYQDGYYVVPAERFYYMWEEGSCTGEAPKAQPWVIAEPIE